MTPMFCTPIRFFQDSPSNQLGKAVEASLSPSIVPSTFDVFKGFELCQDQNTSALYKKILAADYKTPKFISEAVK